MARMGVGGCDAWQKRPAVTLHQTTWGRQSRDLFCKLEGMGGQAAVLIWFSVTCLSEPREVTTSSIRISAPWSVARGKRSDRKNDVTTAFTGFSGSTFIGLIKLDAKQGPK